MKRLIIIILLFFSLVSIGQNELHIDKTFVRSKAYKDRFIPDGGKMLSDRLTKAYMLMAEKHGIAESIEFGWMSGGASKVRDEIYVEKIYNFYDNFNGTQTTASLQPLIENRGIFKSTEDNYLDISSTVVVGTITTVVKDGGIFNITHTDVDSIITVIDWTGELCAYVIRNEVLTTQEKADETSFLEMIYPIFDFDRETNYQGLKWNPSTNTYTRLGSLSDIALSASAGNANLPIQSEMKRCVINNSGIVQYYIDPTDPYLKNGSADSVDYWGTDGQVMVEIPKFYYVQTRTNGEIYYGISLEKLDGMDLHPAFFKDGKEVNYRYYSAFEGSMYDASTGAMTVSGSIASDLYASGDLMCSIADQWAKTNEKRSEYRTMAADRGTGFRQLDWTLNSAVQVLFLIEYANFHTQGMIGAGRTALSGGTWTADSYIGKTGLSISDGNGTNSVSNGGTAGYLTDYMTYRGIENWYGNVWKMVDGLTWDGTWTGVAAAQPVYYTNNSEYFQDYGSENMKFLTNASYIGNVAGYISDFENTVGFIPSDIGSTSLVYDYYYQHSEAGRDYWRVPPVGGHANAGGAAGGFALIANGAWSYVSVIIGARLAY